MPSARGEEAETNMIIWRGWGILAFLAFGLSVGLTSILATLSGTNMDNATWQAILAFCIGGAAVYYLGRYLNTTRPTALFAKDRAQELGYTTQGLDNEVRPLLLEEQPPLIREESAVLKQLRNRHTLFFIPIQWWGILLPLAGIGITAASLSN